ncbi:hypothetical protein SR882_04570 [Guyparkeria halophila]|uniref:Isochorismatase family protein n=1 Tax=Guyparkeria halophila TaxID=47960 RepID=A0ABZ0Z083_9GAMM|nr:hypothetical protein [Guyparkeria halophila]WQH17184.1 hypothetical protein SR882_04570 [Guyparkeria halophila]
MWYVLDRDDEIVAVHEDEPSAIGGARSIVDRMVEQGEFRACVFVVTKAHYDAAFRQGESPRRWHDYKTGGARLIRPSVTSVCR